MERIQSGNARTAQAAVEELQTKCSDSRWQLLILQAGFLTHLAQWMQSDYPAVQASVAKLLEVLASKERNMQAIAQSGAIQPLVAMLDSNTQETRRSALSALRKLCTNQSIRDMVAAAGEKSINLVLNSKVHSL